LITKKQTKIQRYKEIDQKQYPVSRCIGDGVINKLEVLIQTAKTSAERQHNRIVAVLPGSGSSYGSSSKLNSLVRGSCLPLHEISSKSVHNLFSYPPDKQTDRPKYKNITSFGGGNKTSHLCPAIVAIVIILYFQGFKIIITMTMFMLLSFLPRNAL